MNRYNSNNIQDLKNIKIHLNSDRNMDNIMILLTILGIEYVNIPKLCRR